MIAPPAVTVAPHAEPQADGSGHVISELDTVTAVTERESNKVMDQLDQIGQLVNRQQRLVTEIMSNEGAQAPGVQKAILEVMSASKEIQDKVFEAMDLMQFQDITRQKLERILHHLRQIHDYIVDLLGTGRLDFRLGNTTRRAMPAEWLSIWALSITSSRSRWMASVCCHN